MRNAIIRITLLSLISALALTGCYTVLVKPDDPNAYDPDPYNIIAPPVQQSSIGSGAYSWDPWWSPTFPNNSYRSNSFYDPYYYSYYDPYQSNSYGGYGYGANYGYGYSNPIGNIREIEQRGREFGRDDYLNTSVSRDRNPPPATSAPGGGDSGSVSEPTPQPLPEPVLIPPSDTRSTSTGNRETRTVSGKEKTSERSSSSTKEKKERAPRGRTSRPR